MRRKNSVKSSKSSRSGIRYAVVGLGHISQTAVLPAFKSARNSELVALVSGDAQKLKKIGKKYRIENLFSYEQFGEALKTVDAVYITVPNHLHRQYAVRAAQAGVNVLVEKPMAVTEEECQLMIEAAAANRVKLMVAYRLHFEKANLEAIRTVKSNRLGKARIFTSVFAQQVKAKNIRVTEPVSRGGGPVYDMGVYCINAARYLFGAEPTAVSAVSANDGEARFGEIDEMTSAILYFPEDRLASFTCSFGAADIGRYTVVGTKGALTADPAYEYAVELEHKITIGEKTTRRHFAKRDQFAAEIEYFSNCIVSGKGPEPSGVEGLADVRVVQAIYESARTGKVVELPPFPGKKKPSLRQEIRRPAHGQPELVKAEGPGRESA